MNESVIRQCGVLLLAVMSCCTGSSYAANEPESFAVNLSNPGEPAVFELQGFLQITVVGEDRDDMEFTVNAVEDEDEPGRGLTRIGDTPGFIVEELNNVVKFEPNWGDGDYHVIARVPAETSLKLRTINSDDMRVSGVSGEHELSNVNANIYGDDISGSVSAETPNGEIRISLVEVTPDVPMAFSSVNGDVDITLPQNYQANARIDSGRGATYTDFEFEVEANPPTIETQQSGQGTRIEVKREIRGLLNGGGPLLQIKTFNGDVYLRQGN